MYDVRNARLVFEIVRTNIDRIPLSGETAERDEDVLESPSRTVSDEMLLSALNDARRICHEEAKALYLQNKISTFNGPLSNLDQEDMLRPLPGRVYREDGSGTLRECRRREVGEHNFLEDSGRKATPQRPAFTFDGGTLRVYPGPSPTVEVSYIQEPDDITLSDIPDAVWHEAGSDSFLLGPELLPAIVMYVTAKASRSIERIGQHDLYMDFFERLLRPFRRSWRLGRREKYERQVRVDEPEVNTEI